MRWRKLGSERREGGKEDVDMKGGSSCCHIGWASLLCTNIAANECGFETLCFLLHNIQRQGYTMLYRTSMEWDI